MTISEHPAFVAFVDTVAKLRGPEGCPWNRAQTHESLKEYLIEEAYEEVDAVESGNPDRIREELGDVLLQVVLQSQVAADAGDFTIDDVCATINQKMIRRHPHVFGDANAENANEVADLWEQVKLAEKTKARSSEEKHLLDDVPTHFPALLQAQKISRRAVAVGFEWDTIDDVWGKVAEERAELEAAYAEAPKTADGKVLPKDPGAYETAPAEVDPRIAAVEMEFGDMLFALVNVARKMGIDAESALRASNNKFRRRFAAMEDQARAMGRTVEDLSLDEMEECWQRAKQHE
ncbi:MAG: nucleoside triphosphate pyrophosphohydrolase [Eggerthellaceae bacterium]|nr:nucleoside triphosphate pyrophosphohydrolase [Eggerthellaceae bacterium]